MLEDKAKNKMRADNKCDFVSCQMNSFDTVDKGELSYAPPERIKMIEKNKPIGIFDSGIGGLTVFRSIRERLPNESLVYLGDTARVPYGNKSKETIIRYSLENADFLLHRKVKTIVVACNTSSAYAISDIESKNGTPVLGVIEPGVRAALQTTKNNHVGVIGTLSTISSNRYAQGLKMMRDDVHVVSLACPLFVPLVEEGWVDNEVTEMVARRYLSTMLQEGIDTLILGCTHYPLLKKVVQKVMGPAVSLVDSASAVALELEGLLRSKDLLRSGEVPPEQHLYVTDLPVQFEMMARRFLGEDLPQVKRVEL